MVNHRIHFTHQLATKILCINTNRVFIYRGDYDYFLEKSGAIDDECAAITADYNRVSLGYGLSVICAAHSTADSIGSPSFPVLLPPKE